MSKKKHYCTGTSFQSATGKIDYTFTNDFVFRSIFQRNSRILKSLIASLLHISVDDIFSLVVTNPIELNEAIDDKDFILDITLMFNNSTYINLEMQVANLYNWKERSLQYLCRTFDHLKSGEEYTDALRVIHIGFLNFNLFEDDNEFYSFYKLMNENTHRIYSDKFDLRVVNLTQINNATAEDKLYHIDYWAKMFKATTWEELHMIAQKSSILSEACESLFEINADEISRQKSQAREDYYRMQRMIERKLAEQDTLITKQLSLIAEKDSEISAMSVEIASKDSEISAMSDEIASKNCEISAMSDEIASKNCEISAMSDEIASKNCEISAMSDEIASKNCEISAMSDEIASKNCEISAMSDEIARLKALLEKQNK